MAIVCQFYVKMPLQNLYFLNMDLTPPPPLLSEQRSKKLQNWQRGTSLSGKLICMQCINVVQLFLLIFSAKMKKKNCSQLELTFQEVFYVKNSWLAEQVFSFILAMKMR